VVPCAIVQRGRGRSDPSRTPYPIVRELDRLRTHTDRRVSLTRGRALLLCHDVGVMA
jgi:hypothetical protein